MTQGLGLDHISHSNIRIIGNRDLFYERTVQRNNDSGENNMALPYLAICLFVLTHFTG